MARHSKDVECPECKGDHEVDFKFPFPEDGDEKDEEVECECGCVFFVTATVYVEYDFETDEPIVIKSGIKVPEFDVMDTSTWQTENNPNQLELL